MKALQNLGCNSCDNKIYNISEAILCALLYSLPYDTHIFTIQLSVSN